MMQCSSPYTLKESDSKGRSQLVPCGACGACRANRRTEWSFRLKEELKVSSSAWFITLTYSPEHLPHIDTDLNGTLIKTDLQKFIKRLRRRQERDNGPALRYYAVGEYGSRTRRPHYHAIIFNANYDVIRTLSKAWTLGHCHSSAINDARIHYMTKYHVNYDKKQHKDKREPEFALMSRKPGIGFHYTQKNAEWHRENGNLYVINNGYKQNIPRYFKQKIFDEEQLETLNEDRKLETHQKHWEELQRLEDLGHINPEQHIKKSKQHQSKMVKQKGQQKDQL